MGFFVVIDSKTYDLLVNRSIMTQRIDKENGNIEFEYNNFHLNQSWNYKVVFSIDTKIWQYDPVLGVPVLSYCLPYLRFEFSAPKILWGHNLESCSVSDALYAANLVRDSFNNLFGVSIDKVKQWYCYRLDTCANYILDNENQVKAYIRYLQRLDYPRRIKNLYEDTGIYFASRNNTLKVYAKGVEFKKHDRYRFLDELEQQRLQNQANRILRIEVEQKNILRTVYKNLVKRGYFYNTWSGYMKIYDLLENFNLRYEMERVIQKFLGGSETKVMRNLDVYRLLKRVKSNRSANFYFSIYNLIVLHGQKEAKRQIPESTYYDALRLFRQLGISLISADVKKTEYILEKDFPADFSLEMSEHNKYYQLPKAV